MPILDRYLGRIILQYTLITMLVLLGLFTFVYSNVLALGVALIRRGAVHPHLALWVVHLIFLGFAVFLLHRRNLNKPLLPGWSA